MIPYNNRSGWVKDSIFLVHQVLFCIYAIGRGDDMQTKLEGVKQLSNITTHSKSSYKINIISYINVQDPTVPP